MPQNVVVIGRPSVCLFMHPNGMCHPSKAYNLVNMSLWLTQMYQIIFFDEYTLLRSSCTFSLLRRCELVVVVWSLLSCSAVYHCALYWCIKSPNFKNKKVQEKCSQEVQEECSSRHYSGTYWPLKVDLIGCLETSIMNCHSTLRKILEECRYLLHCGGNLNGDKWVSIVWNGILKIVGI